MIAFIKMQILIIKSTVLLCGGPQTCNARSYTTKVCLNRLFLFISERAYREVFVLLEYILSKLGITSNVNDM